MVTDLFKKLPVVDFVGSTILWHATNLSLRFFLILPFRLWLIFSPFDEDSLGHLAGIYKAGFPGMCVRMRRFWGWKLARWCWGDFGKQTKCSVVTCMHCLKSPLCRIRWFSLAFRPNFRGLTSHLFSMLRTTDVSLFIMNCKKLPVSFAEFCM